MTTMEAYLEWFRRQQAYRAYIQAKNSLKVFTD